MPLEPAADLLAYARRLTWTMRPTLCAGPGSIGVAIDHDAELFAVPITSPTGKTVEEISAEIRRGSPRRPAR